MILSIGRHNTYLQDCTGVRDATYSYTIHDLKHLMLKFAFEKSFSEDSGGGGRESNVQLLPYIMHMALYVINTYVSYSFESLFKTESFSFQNIHFTVMHINSLLFIVTVFTCRTRSVVREEKNLTNFLKLSTDKWVENSYEVNMLKMPADSVIFM